eukprot:15468302-Alexandrium_andersonii.AAC.1
MVRRSALGKHGLGFPSSMLRPLSGSSPERLSCRLLDYYARTWGSDFSGRPTPLGRNSCSRRGASLGGWVSGLRWTSTC